MIKYYTNDEYRFSNFLSGIYRYYTMMNIEYCTMIIW